MNPAMDRRRFLKTGGLAAAGILLPSCTSVKDVRHFDLVISGGRILDGTGAAAFDADLGIVGDTIAAVGRIGADQGRDWIDARGLHLCPGFIDIHSHSDGDILRYPLAESRVQQGYTTEITGNCGGSAAPRPKGRTDSNGEDGELPPRRWTSVASYLRVLRETSIAVNHGLLVGQGTLRSNTVGPVDRPLTPAELDAVMEALEMALDEGALGLSSGLEYVPGLYTPPAELEALARIVARKGALYASHMRNEEAALLEAMEEAIAVGRQAGVRVQISHLKAGGRPNWPLQDQALALLERSRSQGLDVLADAYPYTAYSTTLTILLEPWVREGGTEATMKRLQDPALRERIREEVAANVAQDPGGFELIVISRVRSSKNQGAVGSSLAEIAQRDGQSPADTLIRLLVEERTSVGFVGHGMSSENVERVLAHPLVMVGSDGSSMAPEGPVAATRPHPRSYGTCPRVLGHYCRERQIFGLETAVKKMTSMPADRVGLRDRGRIGPGMKADLVLFDAATVADRATFDDPHRYPVGIHRVLVNGLSVVVAGAHTGARPGRILSRV